MSLAQAAVFLDIVRLIFFYSYFECHFLLHTLWATARSRSLKMVVRCFILVSVSASLMSSGDITFITELLAHTVSLSEGCLPNLPWSL